MPPFIKQGSAAAKVFTNSSLRREGRAKGIEGNPLNSGTVAHISIQRIQVCSQLTLSNTS